MIIPLTKGRRETYPCTHPVLLGREDGRAMTLGVGVLCDHGETIVIGSEQRASYRTTENIAIGPNDECGKQFYMKPHRVFVSVAGRMSTCHSVYSQFAHLVNHLKEPSNIPAERMMALIDEARFHTLKRLYDWELKKEMGVTLHQWASGRLPRGRKMDELVVKFGLKILEAMPFRCELIVGGFQDENAFFMRACQKGAIEEETSPGVYAIGIGQTSAMRHLNKRGQNVHMGLPRTLLHVYEALHLSQSQYVGPPPEFLIVITKRDNLIMVYPTASLEGWRKAYEARNTTASLDDSDVAGKDVLHRLRELREG